MTTAPKILIWDLESAGIQGLYGDRSFLTCFGYKWFRGAKTKVLNILDYPGKNCQDDKNLMKAALEVIEEADFLVAHYGEKHDRPYFRTRLAINKLKPMPPTRQFDTCLWSQQNLKLSSNRLANLAQTLNVPVKKMEKGRGWPDWWMGAVRGDVKSLRDMAYYCAIDVDCLEGCFEAILPAIPPSLIPNRSIGEKLWTCSGCGGHRRHSRGSVLTNKKIYNRYQCQSCGRWSRGEKAVDGVLWKKP